MGRPIGEGDEDWPEILKALAEIGYDGWATAEVGGGGEEYLKKISAQMDKVLVLTEECRMRKFPPMRREDKRGLSFVIGGDWWGISAFPPQVGQSAFGAFGGSFQLPGTGARDTACFMSIVRFFGIVSSPRPAPSSHFMSRQRRRRCGRGSP